MLKLQLKMWLSSHDRVAHLHHWLVITGNESVYWNSAELHFNDCLQVFTTCHLYCIIIFLLQVFKAGGILAPPGNQAPQPFQYHLIPSHDYLAHLGHIHAFLFSYDLSQLSMADHMVELFLQYASSPTHLVSFPISVLFSHSYFTS